MVIWQLALCLLLSSIIVSAALIKGIKSSGKVVYFTATFPYVVILILLIRGVTLEGAQVGIDYYIGTQSNLTKLREAEPWKDAATQIFYSLSIAWGGVITLSSYNQFHNDVFKDTLLITFANSGTSVFAGFAIFSILGHMAHVYNISIREVVDEGFSLAFIAYPDALSKLPISPLWSILFFFMLLTVGLDSQFAGLEVIISTLIDAYPTKLKSKHGLLTVAISGVLFFLGLPCVTESGIYWVTLIDKFAGSWVLLVLALFELISVSYIYGLNRFIEDMEMMMGKKSFAFWLWWRACWFFITPCVIGVIFVWSIVTLVPPLYGQIPYPDWGIAIGWCIVVFLLIWIPVVAVYKLIRAEGNLWKRVKSLCTPSEQWHPYMDAHRGDRYPKDSSSQMKNNPNRPEVDVNVISDSRF